MRRIPGSSPFLSVFLTLGLMVAGSVGQDRFTVENSSRDGQLSHRRFDGYQRRSFYIEARDGTRLAVDLFRPTSQGRLHQEALPLVWTHDRYHRASVRGGRLVTKLDLPAMRELVRRGYLVAAVDVRGAGASFGRYQGPFHPQEMTDAFDVTEWFAAQPWCNGKIGMYGGSYLGATQYLAAATRPPHLVAIMPSVAPGDLYQTAYGGGIYHDDLIESWSVLTRRLDVEIDPAAVEGTAGESLLRAARSQHDTNRITAEQLRAMPYRDSVDPEIDLALYEAGSPLSYLEEISESGVAIYHLAGWFDPFVRDALVLSANLDNAQRIAVGPWFHQDRHEFDDLGEHLKWYDYWLKGIDDGVMDQAPIHYYTMNDRAHGEWRSAWEWPLPEEVRRSFWFHANPEGPPSAGELKEGMAPAVGAAVHYRMDSTTSSGTATRWTNAYGGPKGYPDMSGNDAKAISFTTPELNEDVEVTGHPVVDIWLIADGSDCDLFVYLEEVEASGTSSYVTEGCLRVSLRQESEPPYYFFDLPFHRLAAADVKPVPEGPFRVSIDLFPTSNIFNAGNRIRVAIACADADNCATPETDPPQEIDLLCDPEHPSRVVLPVLGGDD